MKFVLTFLASLTLVAACSATDEESIDSAASDSVQQLPMPEIVDPIDVATVNGMRDQWVSAFASGDASQVDFMFTGDAVFLPPDHAALSGNDEPIHPGVRLFDRFTAELALSDELKIADGDWAYYMATYALSLTPKGSGNTIEDSGQFFTSWNWVEDSPKSKV